VKVTAIWGSTFQRLLFLELWLVNNFYGSPDSNISIMLCNSKNRTVSKVTKPMTIFFHSVQGIQIPVATFHDS
jgi:hypothetical protein